MASPCEMPVGVSDAIRTQYVAESGTLSPKKYRLLSALSRMASTTSSGKHCRSISRNTPRSAYSGGKPADAVREGNAMKVRNTVHPCGTVSVAASPGEEDGYGNEAIAAAYAEYLWTEGWKPCG